MIASISMRLFLPVATALTLVACATNAAMPEPIENSDGGSCDAAPVQSYVGREATRALGAAILEHSGAKTLRWGAPDSAWTMDFREDRVNVRYDEDRMVTDITCG